uniref:Uncharacterized protein n=1 Tax=Pyrodinium bahamense TaxID=73915 RepID=A0A7S0A3L6_9DINO|mmetsp:Transcript_20915/g.57908  ORF Transcript_20915/g.57908 Transcript_20915/m.57908 type:complete len:127 (+) Transcript_20915:342-722(+)
MALRTAALAALLHSLVLVMGNTEEEYDTTGLLQRRTSCASGECEPCKCCWTWTPGSCGNDDGSDCHKECCSQLDEYDYCLKNSNPAKANCNWVHENGACNPNFIKDKIGGPNPDFCWQYCCSKYGR